MFAEFYSDLNVPSSDIAAGFVLLSKYQAAQREWIIKHKEGLGVDCYLSNIPIREDTKFLDISTAEDSHLINDLIYYMNYSLAIFGWPMQMVDDPCMLCCIYPYLRLSPCCSSRGKKKSSRSTKHSDENKKRVESNKHDKNKTKNEFDKIDHADTNNDNSDNNSNEINEGQTETKEEQHQQDMTNSDSSILKSKQPIAGQLNDDCDVPIILEDNCCSCNAASAERRLAQHNYEIIYISYKCSVNVVPFLVAADHSKQAIVVAIRGSMSLSDMVTDMNGTIDKVPIEGCPDDWLCHRGITRAAQYVKESILNGHILDRAFNCRPDLGSKEYQLILCGHSLGAGAAAILGILLREQYPSLRAYLYSPPGGILSMSAVEYTKKFAIGIILGNDTVPRLGVAQLERLRYHTLLSLNSAQKSSGRILARALCPSICFGSNKVEYDPEQSLDLLHGVEARSFDHNGVRIPFQTQRQVLYVPGRLIHVVKNYSFKSKTRRLWSGPIYQAVWTENASYDRVLISEGMFFDHLPNNLMHAMKMLFSRTLPGRRDSKLSPTSTPVPSTGEINEVTSDSNRKSFEQNVGNDNIQRHSADKHIKVAQFKHVIEDDNNNNNEDENNNNELDTNMYPDLNRNNSKSDIENLPTNIIASMKAEYLDENGNEKI